MIKVNLLKQQGSGAGGNTRTGTFANIRAPKLEGASQGLLIRGAAIALPLILVYAFGYYNDTAMRNEIASLQQTLTKFDTDIGSLKPALDSIEKLNAEKNKISKQIAGLKVLSKKRYVLAKIMDSIQNLIPEKAWLVKLSYKDNTIVVEGRAPDDTTVSSFMQNLEESSLFANVTWIDSKEVNEPQGVVKLFNIQFNLENI